MKSNSIFRVSVRLILLDGEREYILVVQEPYRPQWGLPGGGVIPGEQIYETAQREIVEEFSLSLVDEFLHVGFDCHFDERRGIHSLFIILAGTYDKHRFRTAGPSNEVSAIAELAVDHLRDAGATDLLITRWLPVAVEALQTNQHVA